MPKFNFITTPERSKRMSNIRGKNTRPEILLRKALYSSGVRYRLNVDKLPGKPDIVINKFKIAIFIDGDFWHGYNWEEKKIRIKSNAEYWISKIERNMQRDIENNNALENLGYYVIRFWDHEVNKHLQDCVMRVQDIIKKNI